MISKIQMEDVACYQAAANLETDKKVNLIYGLNGTGKSTISNFLYDTSGADYAKCSADIGVNETVLVYNQRFIKDHFYEADKLKGIFSLSKENKDIAEKLKVAEAELITLVTAEGAEQEIIDSETQQMADKKTAAIERTWEIKKRYTGRDKVLDFCLDNLKGSRETLFDHITAIANPDSQPAKSSYQIKKEVESIDGESAQKHDPLPNIKIEVHETEDHQVYKSIVVGSADSPVAPLIDKLKNSDWVKKGLEFMPNPEAGKTSPCPFCQEQTITEALATDIENYFDKSFDESIELIKSHLEHYETEAANLLSLDVYKTNPLASERAPELQEKHSKLEKILHDNLVAISKKKSTPSLPVSLISTQEAVSELNGVITEINAYVTRHNERFDNVGAELAKLKREFWDLMRWDYDQTISSWNSGKNATEKVLIDAKLRKQQALKNTAAKRAEISKFQSSTVNIEAAIVSINNGLSQLGLTDFSISKHKDALYRIVRTGEAEANFSSLSEGEKMIISFLYFCEVCRGKRTATETVQKKIVVIDDPISSLSHIFVFNIGQMLKTEFFSSPRFEQVYVLTHSLYFFYELADSNHKRRNEAQKLFRLTKNAHGSGIKSMKYEEVQNDYQSYWLVVTDRNQPPAIIANCMRNIIEYFFNFVQKADFSNVIQKPELQENRYQAFCRYVNRESHSLGQNIFDYKEFNYDDFRDGLRLVFEVTGYPEHYKKMTHVLTHDGGST